MSEAVAAETQAVEATPSQVDTTQPSETPAVEEQSVSLEDMKKVRSEAANLRKRLKDAEAKLGEFETANQSDEERRTAELTSLQERASRAEAALREANGRNAVYSNAGNAIDAELLYLYVEKQGIEFDDDGAPTNVDDLITKAREAKPSLFQRGSADGAARSSVNTYEPAPGVERIAHAYETNSKQRSRT